MLKNWKAKFALNKSGAMRARRRAYKAEKAAVAGTSDRERQARREEAKFNWTEARRFEKQAAICRNMILGLGGTVDF